MIYTSLLFHFYSSCQRRSQVYSSTFNQKLKFWRFLNRSQSKIQINTHTIVDLSNKILFSSVPGTLPPSPTIPSSPADFYLTAHNLLTSPLYPLHYPGHPGDLLHPTTPISSPRKSSPNIGSSDNDSKSECDEKSSSLVKSAFQTVVKPCLGSMDSTKSSRSSPEINIVSTSLSPEKKVRPSSPGGGKIITTSTKQKATVWRPY